MMPCPAIRWLSAFVALFFVPAFAAAALPPDSCADCHAEGKVTFARFSSTAHGAVGCAGCHTEVPEDHMETGKAGPMAACTACHGDITAKGPLDVHLQVDASGTPKSSSCRTCHQDLHHKPRTVSCERCHADAAKDLEGSEHWKPGAAGKPHRVGCTDCHAQLHHIRPPADAASELRRENVYQICARCHDDPKNPARNPITGDVFVPVASYRASVHGQKLGKIPNVADCTDCHGHHGFRRITDPSSKLSRTHVIETCGKCHQGKLEDYKKGVHGHMLKQEEEKTASMKPEEYKRYIETTPLNQRAPVCTSCHTSHSIRPATHLGEFDEVQRLCSQCHAKEVKELGLSVHRRVPVGIGTDVAEKTGAAPATPPGEAELRDIRCQDCHVDYHENRDIRAGDSVVNKRNLADACARCHSQPVTSSESGRSFNPIESYKESIHGRGVYQSGLFFSAGCVDCHGSHFIFPLKDPRSTLHHEQLPETCGNANCHVGIYDKYVTGTHGQYFLKEKAEYLKLPPEERSEFVFKGPACTSCHTSHSIRRTDQTAFFGDVMRQCGHCHPLAMATYKRSYHGKAALLGSGDVAKCQDCHGSHVNPRMTGETSTYSPEKMLDVCRRCHKNATMEMVSYINHLELKKQLSRSEAASLSDPEREKLRGLKVLLGVRFMMELLLVSVFIFFGIHTVLWFIRGIIDRIRGNERVPIEKKTEYFVRIDRYNRIVHVFVVMSFMGLALTGLPIKYPEDSWSGAVFSVLDSVFQGNGAQIARLFHRVFAIVTFGYLFFHLAYLFRMFLRSRHERTLARFKPCPVDRTIPYEARGLGWYARYFLWWVPVGVAYIPVNLYMFLRDVLVDRRELFSRIKYLYGPQSVIPRPKDLKDMLAHFKWFFGLGKKPTWDQWTYYEKFDYWAVFWGVAIIGSTGLCMWFKEFFTSTLGFPGWVINVAMEVHSHEALLAIGFIFSIHFFNGHLRPGRFPMDRVIFFGVVNRHELEDERPEQYKRLLESGRLEAIRGQSPPMWLRVLGTTFGFVALTVGIIVVIWIFRMELAHLFRW